MKADVSRAEEHLTFQFNTTDEGESVFYAEVKDSVLRVEPYEYYDGDAKFVCPTDTLVKLASGKLDPVFAFATGKLKVEGSLEEALILQMFVQAGTCAAPESQSVRGKEVRYMGTKGRMLGLAAAGVAGEYGTARHLFRRIVVRRDAKRDGTQKMAGMGWDAYIPSIRANGEWLVGQSQEDVHMIPRDGLRLHGTFLCCEDSRRAVVCFYSYTSEGPSDYTSITKFYPNQGFNLMVVDEKTHGKSESTCIGFGCLGRYSALQWMEYVVRRLREDCGLIPHGTSMEAVIALISAGLELPEQVKAAVSDCAFTSAWETFSHVLRSMYHIPAFPVIQITDRMIRRGAGYSLDECSARKEAIRAHIPILFIYRDRDTFVPCFMVHKLYGVCASSEELLVIPGAGHIGTHYRDTGRYEHAIEEPIVRIFGKGENRV